VDKILLKFFADVLYLKGIICYEEFEAILDCCTPHDLDVVFERMMKEDFNYYARGENNWEY